MHNDGTPEERARQYANRTKIHLVVRTGKDRQRPIWDAFWRDSERRQVMRRIGPAWLVRRAALANPFTDSAPGRTTEHEPKVQESWRNVWEPRGTTGKGKEAMLNAGAFDVNGAGRRAIELVVIREVEIHAARAERAEQARRSTPEYRAEMEAARSKLMTTFAMVARQWYDETSVTAAWKPTVARDYASMLASPYDVPRVRARPTKATMMRALGNQAVFAIDTAQVRKLLTSIARDTSHRTANKYRTVLSMIFDFAVREGHAGSNPVTAIKPFKVAQATDLVVLSIEQVEAVARAAGPQMGEMIRLAANTGLRQGEVTALCWGDVRWEQRSIFVARSRSGGLEEVAPKSNAGRLVPMSDYVAEILERLAGDGRGTRKRDLIFASSRGNHVNASALRRAYIAARDKVRADDSDVPEATWHELRHTFGTSCAAAGLPLLSVQRWMGHADINTTMRYLHYVAQHDDADRVSKALAFAPAGVAVATKFNASTPA
jgi:integrase